MHLRTKQENKVRVPLKPENEKWNPMENLLKTATMTWLTLLPSEQYFFTVFFNIFIFYYYHSSKNKLNSN